MTALPNGFTGPEFPPEPDPHHGCATCADLSDQRERYRNVHDLSGVTDCNVLIRRHPHENRA